MSILIGLIGVAAVLGLAWGLSTNRSKVNFKAVGIMLGLQLLVTVFMFKTSVGMKVVELVSSGFTKVMGYGREGVNFVVGGLEMGENGVFFINVLMLIIFTSVLLSILTHIKVLPMAIKYIGGGLSKLTGLPRVETFNAVNSIFFGQSEALLAVKDHLPKMNRDRLFMISTSAMASVSASIIGAYMQMIPAQYVLVAMILNALSALIVCSIAAPVEAADEEEIDIKEVSKTKSVFEAISVGALDGGKVALIVAAMLVAYIGLLALVNAAFVGVVGTELTTVLGYVLAPIAWIMGVPAADMVAAGSIMGTKLVANEFVAMLQLMPMIESLAPKTVGILSAFLTSFAAFGSIGIIGGTMQAINGEKAAVVAGFGLKMLLMATLSSVLTATVIGLFL